MYQQDLNLGYGAVTLPFALARKYPNAERQWVRQFVFPTSTRCKAPLSGAIVRFYLNESGLQKAVKRAVCHAGAQKRVGCHTFRHSFATHLLEKSLRHSHYSRFIGPLVLLNQVCDRSLQDKYQF